MGLRKRVAQSAMWSFWERGSQQGISFLVFMVVARLIGPEEYGLANLCFIYFLLAVIVTNTLVDGVISQQRDDDLGLSSLFWLTTGIGLGLSALCFLTAGQMSIFMESPKLEALLKSFSIVPFLMAVSALPNSLIQKNMDYKIFAIRTLVATLCGGGVGIFMAYHNWGAYAIIGQQITLYLVMNLVVWGSITWRPKLLFSKQRLFEIVRPGLGAMGMGFVVYFDDQTPRFVIGGTAGSGMLGHYALATRLLLALSEILVTPVLTVLFPAFASILHDKERQKNLAEQILLLIYSSLFPIIACLIAAAPVYVPLLFGEKWVSAIPVIQILFITLFFAPMTQLTRQLFRAHGQLARYAKIKIILSLLNLLSLLLLFLPDGVVVFAWAVVVMACATQFMGVYILDTMLDISLWGSEVQSVKILPLALLAAGAAYGADSSVFVSFHPVTRLLLMGGITGGIYLGLYRFVMKKEFFMAFEQIKKLLNRKSYA